MPPDAQATLPVGWLTSGAGWTRTTRDASGRTATETTDYFGRTSSRTDFGGHTYTLTYNRAGQLKTQTSTAGQSLTYAYFNTGRLYSLVDGSLNTTMTYGYDAEGNITAEALVSGGTKSIKNTSATYDAQNRLLTFKEFGVEGANPIQLEYAYTKEGDIRRIITKRQITGQVAQNPYATDDTDWYDYDTLGQMTVSKGAIVNGVVGINSTKGVAIAYDAAGRRAYTEKWTNSFDRPNIRFLQREAYTYYGDGYLKDVTINEYPNGNLTTALRARDDRDLMGRVTSHAEFDLIGTPIYTRTLTYNGRSEVTKEVTWTNEKSTITNATTT